MTGTRTRGHPTASDAIGGMLRTHPPHAVLFVGAPGVGKTTLALDLAAGLLCTAASAELRPCGECRGCRMVASGNHPDLHRLAPDGAGGQVRLGARTNAEPGTVRRLSSDLALLPVEGGARVAIIERADRMNEDAQSALLKTLEEPPQGVTIVLCADEEERLLPTVRSRCARIRLGPVPIRDVEVILAREAGTDPGLGARLARLSGGRPGAALAWARAPESVALRAEIGRTLLDLLDAPPARRLTTTSDLLRRAGELLALLEGPAPSPPATRSRRAGGAARPDPEQPAPADAGDGTAAAAVDATRTPAAERRRAAVALLGIWRDLGRDLAVASLAEWRAIRDTALLDDLAAAAPTLAPGAAAAFLATLDRAGELLESNVSPELALDVLALAWPRPSGGRAPATRA